MSNEAHNALARNIVTLLAGADRALVEGSILALYERQTGDEQEVRQTRHFNARGWQHGDAGVMSLAAERLSVGGHLEAHEAASFGARLVKYRHQLAWIAEDRLVAARASAVPAAESASTMPVPTRPYSEPEIDDNGICQCPECRAERE